MKKYILFLIFLLCSLSLMSCKKSYTIRFEINGYGTQPPMIREANFVPLELPTLSHEGYRFDGWYFDEEWTQPANSDIELSRDITLYAKWTKLYTITFNMKGHGQEIEPMKNRSDFQNLVHPTEAHWVFKGWYLDEDLTIILAEDTELKADTTLYAKWEKAEYCISFMNVDIDPIYITYGDKVIIENEPTKEGYRFEGWYQDQAFQTPWNTNQLIENDTQLYAKWQKLYQIVFDTNGYGKSPDTIKNIDSIPSELPVLEQQGYLFDGWFLDEKFEHRVVEGSILKEDLVVFAKWIQLEGYPVFETLDETVKKNLSVDGYAQEGIEDFIQYYNTDAYRVVTTPLEFLTALQDARVEYKNTWDESTKTVKQSLIRPSSVHVIEIKNDLNLGYFKLGSLEKATNLVTDFASKMKNLSSYLVMSDMLLENGISQIKIENTSNLLIYSQNGAKLTHCGFKLTSDTNVVFRNLEFDELWQWEDALVSSASKIGDYDWFGWAYFKIAFCGFIWIDHCTFGKSYDGQIDYSNPVYDANAGTAFRAPFGATGENGLHISWCRFQSGSADEDGYIYKMMEKLEQEYQENQQKNLYYKALRDANISFEDILYGLALPQKKGFLCGDDAKFSGSYDTADDYNFNLKLKISFSNCVFLNIEDRLPKLRGGNAYMYNCLVDCSTYATYRTKLLNQNAKNVVTSVNSGWKCALVSQGIVCGNGGSVMVENTIFKGIDALIKHNDTKNVSPYVDGGFKFVNCSYQRSPMAQTFIGSSDDSTHPFVSNLPAKLNPNNFSWKTDDAMAPYQIATFSIDRISQILFDDDFGSGIRQGLKQMYLYSKYN